MDVRGAAPIKEGSIGVESDSWHKQSVRADKQGQSHVAVGFQSKPESFKNPQSRPICKSSSQDECKEKIRAHMFEKYRGLLVVERDEIDLEVNNANAAPVVKSLEVRARDGPALQQDARYHELVEDGKREEEAAHLLQLPDEEQKQPAAAGNIQDDNDEADD